ncbi:MAG: hypothetical protein HGA87_00725 [Desulfobulbaceae bacterium]|nr:hypothetical protein [Desulfobulbaceae bacterium]
MSDPGCFKTKRERAQFLEKAFGVFNMQVPTALTRRIALQDKLAGELAKKEGLVSAFGVEKIMQFQDKVLRLQNSAFGSSREIINKLAESFTWKEKNVAGERSVVPVSNAVRDYHRLYVDAAVKTDELFAKYRGFDTVSFSKIKAFTEDKFKATGRLTRQQFNEEIGKAMRNGDAHAIPEIAEAAKTWRAEVVDPVTKMAQEQGLLPEHLEVKTAESYMHRMWNTDRIIAKREEFVNGVVIPHLQRMGDDAMADMTPDQIKYLAGQITDRLVGTPAGRLPYDIGDASMFPKLDVPGLRGPLKPRVFDIEDNLVQDWLINDVEQVSRAFIKNTAADIELTKMFGNVDLLDQIDRVRAEHAELALRTDLTEKDRVVLARMAKQNEQDILDTRDIIRGTFARDDHASPMGRAMRNIKSWNYLRLLGGMTVSALPDIGSVVFYHGLQNTLQDAVIPLLNNKAAFKAAAGEVADAGTALDMVIGSRFETMGDIDYYATPTDKFSKGIHNATNIMGLVSLMTPWNTALKKFVGVISQSEIIKACQRLAAGTSPPEEITRLAANYINRDIAEQIAEQAGRHSERHGGLVVPNARVWDNETAQYVFRAAVRREVDGVIVTPDLDRPTFLSKPLLGTVGQFKSFAFASTQRVLISGLQRHDMAALQGVFMMTGLGMMAYAFKTADAGRELSDDPKVWVQEGIDRSGLVSVLFDINNTAEKISRGQIGLSRFTGAQGTRYFSRGVADVLLGPSAGMLTDVAKVTGDAAGMKWNESDTRAARRVLPYQNLILYRRLLDQAEVGINEAMGIKKAE